jgi:molybdopterin synthase catalytic subunit
MQKTYLIDGPVTHEIITSVIDEMAVKKDAGGHTFFLGQVRADIMAGKTVKAIEYSAYEGMVKAEADQIIKSVLEEFNDLRSVDIVHSTGLVKAGEISLLVAVAAGHRKQAMEACSKTVELIKERLPVWKKEVYEDDSHTWK